MAPDGSGTCGSLSRVGLATHATTPPDDSHARRVTPLRRRSEPRAPIDVPHATAVRVTDVTGAGRNSAGAAVPRGCHSGGFHCLHAQLGPHGAPEHHRTHELDIARFTKRNLIMRDGKIVSDVPVKDRLDAETEVRLLRDAQQAVKLTV